MQTNPKFEKTARYRRQVAVIFALLFHIALLAAVAYGSSFKQILPNFVRAWISEETVENASANRP